MSNTPPVKPIIVPNVSDGRIGWIGPWEVEPLPVTLGPELIGRTVIYVDHNRAEAGTVTSYRDSTIFARYSRGDTAAGARLSDLQLGVRPLTTEELLEALTNGKVPQT